MSKAPKNIEKILLAAGLVVGAGLGALGYLQLGKAEEEFGGPAPNPGPSDVEVSGAAEVPGTVNSLQSNRELQPGEVPSQRLESGRREVDLFVGVPLYAKEGETDDPFDPLQSADIHPPIPNEWWLRYGVSPNHADSPRRDHDDDGFTNLEEFEAGTRPDDPASHPELALKLAYVDDESLGWFVKFGTEIQGKWAPRIYEVEDGAAADRPANRVSPLDLLEAGDIFFEKEPFKDRFIFLRIEDREVFNERTNITENLRFALYEDLRPNKKGKPYEIPNRLPEAEEPKYYHYDRTAVLELRAVGEQGKEFKVEENTRFSLPSGDGEMGYLLKRVTPDEIEIEWEVDGETRSRVIPKD